MPDELWHDMLHYNNEWSESKGPSGFWSSLVSIWGTRVKDLIFKLCYYALYWGLFRNVYNCYSIKTTKNRSAIEFLYEKLSSYKFILWYLVYVNSILENKYRKVRSLFLDYSYQLSICSCDRFLKFGISYTELLISLHQPDLPEYIHVQLSKWRLHPSSCSGHDLGATPDFSLFYIPTFKWSAYSIDSIFTIDPESNQSLLMSFITTFLV